MTQAMCHIADAVGLSEVSCLLGKRDVRGIPPSIIESRLASLGDGAHKCSV